MAKRKLVKQGATTHMVSLPSKWIKANNLKKGEEVEVEEKQNSIVVSLDPKKSKRPIQVDLASPTNISIRTILINSYRLGYDKITISFKDKKAIETIQNTVRDDLVGFEIVRKTENRCEIENVTEPSKDQFDSILSKIFVNIKDLLKVTEDMLQGKRHEFEGIEKRIQQYDNFCRRVVAKTNLFDQYQLRWAFHAELMHAQREIYLLLKYLKKNKPKTDKHILFLLENCKNMFDLLRKGYEEKNTSLLEKMQDIEKNMSYKRIHSILRKTGGRIEAHHLISAIKKFYLASSPLIGSFI